MKYPELNNKQWISVLVKVENQWTPAMYYINGGKPVFASYGLDITNKVQKWKYNN